MAMDKCYASELFTFFQSQSLNIHQHMTGCAPCRLPEFPFRAELQLSTVVTCMIIHPLLAAFSPLSHFPSHVSFTCQTNSLHLDSCFSVCLRKSKLRLVSAEAGI